MKAIHHKLISALFLFVFLSAFSSGLYISLKNSISDLAHFSKNKEIKTNTYSGNNSEDFVFEENIEEGESDINPELLAFVLPFFISFNQTTHAIGSTPTIEPLVAQSSKPIYLTVCDFRI